MPDVVPVPDQLRCVAGEERRRLGGQGDLVVVQAVLDAERDTVRLGVRGEFAQRLARLLEPGLGGAGALPKHVARSCSMRSPSCVPES